MESTHEVNRSRVVRCHVFIKFWQGGSFMCCVKMEKLNFGRFHSHRAPVLGY